MLSVLQQQVRHPSSIRSSQQRIEMGLSRMISLAWVLHLSLDSLPFLDLIADVGCFIVGDVHAYHTFELIDWKELFVLECTDIRPMPQFWRRTFQILQTYHVLRTHADGRENDAWCVVSREESICRWMIDSANPDIITMVKADSLQLGVLYNVFKVALSSINVDFLSYLTPALQGIVICPLTHDFAHIMCL